MTGSQAGSAPGVGLIETFAVIGGRPRHLGAHLDRMAASAREIGIPGFSRGAVEWAVAAVVARRDGDAWDDASSAVLRVELRPDGGIDVTPRPAGPAGLGELFLVDEDAWAGSGAEPVTLVIDDVPVAPSPLLRHKTTARAVYDDARARHPHADDVVLINAAGRVTETTVANFAALVVTPDGPRWVTPPVADGLLPGIGRALLLESGGLVERSLTPADARVAEALAVISSTRGWRRARLG